jgi:hypothetical protein
MLSPASWLPIAQTLEPDSRLRTEHDCGPGRTLTVRRDEKGLHAFCFRCNDHGWQAPAPESLTKRLARLSEQRKQDDRASAAPDLPMPATRLWQEWPVPCKLWLLKAGLCSADLPKLGAYYHRPSNRVVLPVLDPLLGLLFWQARAVDGRQPKYLAPAIDKTQVIARYGAAQDGTQTVTLTEDLLSAYKVGSVAEAWCLLGTSMNSHMLSALIERGCKVNVWLDPDPPGRRAATKVLAALRAAGITARNIVSKKDPKLLHRAEIKELLL